MGELVKRVTIVIAMLVLVLTIVKKLIKSLIVGICRCFYIPYVPYSDPSQVMVLRPVLPATDAQMSDLSDSLRKQWIAVPYAEPALVQDCRRGSFCQMPHLFISVCDGTVSCACLLLFRPG